MLSSQKIFFVILRNEILYQRRRASKAALKALPRSPQKRKHRGGANRVLLKHAGCVLRKNTRGRGVVSPTFGPLASILVHETNSKEDCGKVLALQKAITDMGSGVEGDIARL